MDAERDYLRDHGFPRLAERLRERCHHLDTIDLRQGVESAGDADEARREMQVLKVCLDEIERSRPFLVALLGERYGWIPPAERIAAAARDAGLPETVEVTGRSVTELEILHGVLENPDQRRRSWFYFRTLDRTGMPAEVSARFPEEDPSADPASPAGRLAALKDRIRREMPGRVREYTLRWDPDRGALGGLDELDRQVAADLWSDLDAETADYLRRAPRTWQEADARAVADFVVERTRGYVERPAVTDPMIEHALSPPAPDAAWGLSVTADSGGGKSSLFGRVCDALHPRAQSGQIVLLAHAAGIFPMSGQVDRMLRRWVFELAAHLGRPDPLERPDQPQADDLEGPHHTKGGPRITSDDIDQAFASLLGQVAAQRRVVVLVDALNQFEPTVRSQHVTWLPKLWPGNARLIATAIPCQATAALAERPGCRELPVPPVTAHEAREIARRFYRERHHRDTNERVLEALLGKRLPAGGPAHGNPLWLALALQEMNLLEADDFERADREYADLPGAERMQALQLDEAHRLPADVPGMYGELLDRAERGFGRAWARAFTGLVAVSRAGWRESDLRELMPAASGRPWDELAFADVRRALGAHVVQRGAQAQWDFFHAALRETVLRRDLADEVARKRLHGLIGDHLDRLPAGDPLRIGESMFHLLGLGDRERAANYLAVSQLQRRSRGDAGLALAAAVAVMVEAIRSAADEGARQQQTDWIAALMGGEHDERCGRVANVILFDLSDALAITGEARTEAPRFHLLQAARATLQRLAATDPSNAGWQRDLSVSHNKVGDVLLDQGDLAGALGAYRQSLAVAERLAAADPSNAQWQQDLGISNERIGDVLLTQGNLTEARHAYELKRRITERLAAADASNASWQRGLSVTHHKIGDVLLAQGDLVGALRSYRESRSILERLTAALPSNVQWQHDMGISNERIGDVLLAQGNLDEARHAYELGRRIIERLAAADPSNAGWQRGLSVNSNKVGDVLLAQGDLADALIAYQESLGIAERLSAADPSNAGWQRDLLVSHTKVGDVLRAQGDLAGAFKAYRVSLGVAERLAAADPSNAGWQRDLSVSHNKIGDALRAQGNLTGALRAFRQSLGIRERLVAADPSNAGWQRDLSVSQERIGDVLRAQGDLVGTLGAYRESLGVAARLVTADPSNAGWQRDLSVSQERIGDVLLAQGDLAGALGAYRVSLEIREHLAKFDLSHAGWQRDLAVSQERIGDVQRAQGDLAGALSAYRESLSVRKRLAAADLSNAGWQRDLSVSQEKVGDVLLAQADLAGALQFYRESLGIAESLAASDPSNATWQRDLSVSQEKVGDVLLAQADLAGALQVYRESLGIRERLSAADLSNASWQRDLVLSYWRMADITERTGHGDAMAWWLKAYEQLAGMKQRGIMQPTDEQYLAVLRERAGL